MKFFVPLTFALLTKLALAPVTVVVATAKGEMKIPVRSDSTTGPVIAASTLLPVLGGTDSVGGTWVTVTLGGSRIELMLEAPFYRIGGELKPMVGAAVIRRDSLFLPIQFVTRILPLELPDRFQYDAKRGRLDDLIARAGVSTTLTTDTAHPKRKWVVTIDPGHGGHDPGNPGIYFPKGLKEKDVTLAIGIMVREELKKRNVDVIMTRTRDTLIQLRDRAGYCRDDCSLFVSLHVNSVERRSGYTRVRGFETYFLADAQSEDARRVAKMENDAVRFEATTADDAPEALDFILKDLQQNEYLRESARLAELMQAGLSRAHPGPDKGVKQGPFTVLYTAKRPAVLVELGFSTNPDDARVMTERRSQRQLALSVAEAIVDYLQEYNRRVGADGEPGQDSTGGK